MNNVESPFEKIQVRILSGSEEELARINPVLEARELFGNVTLRKFKFGDGKTSWKELPYVEEEKLFETLTQGITIVKR